MKYLLISTCLAVSVCLNAQEKEMKTEQSERYQKGLENLMRIDGEAGEKVVQHLDEISPDLGKYVIEYPFGDIYDRDVFTNREKEIAVVAALAALGNAQPQLKVHINAALNVGLTPEELKEIMIIMSVYAGFPAALNGTFALEEVLKERNK